MPDRPLNKQPHSLEKKYPKVCFSAETIRRAIETYDRVTPREIRSEPNVTLTLTESGEQWCCPTLELFLQAYPKSAQASYFRTSYFKDYFDAILSVTFLENSFTHVRIEAPEREQVAAVANVFEANASIVINPLPAEIEYVGLPGVTQECIDAIMRLAQDGRMISRVRLLSHSNSHCFFLTRNSGDLMAVKSGFGSGNLGEKSRGLSFVLSLFEDLNIPIEEYDVSSGFLDRIDRCTLTKGDIEQIDRAKPVRPTRWSDYVFDEHAEHKDRGTLWQNFPPLIPWAIMEPRIIDLALRFFERPNEVLLTGYVRLEDAIRKRTGIEDHGAALFSKAFLNEPPKLVWQGVTAAERIGRANLFIGAYMAYRNARAHRELENNAHDQLAEFLLLNHLYILEYRAVES